MNRVRLSDPEPERDRGPCTVKIDVVTRAGGKKGGGGGTDLD